MILKKFYSPFFLSLFAIILCSCSKEKNNKTFQNSALIDSINNHIHNSDTEADSSGTYRLQEIDKASQLAVSGNIDSLMLKTMEKKSDILFYYFPDKAESFTNTYLEFSEKKKDTFHIAMAKRNLGRYFMGKNDRLAFEHLNAAKLLFENKDQKEQMMYVLLLMSDILEKSNDYAAVETTNTELLSINKKDNHRYYNTCAYNNLGIAYKSIQEYKKAIDNFKKALVNNDDPEYKWIIESNIGLNYTYLADYKEAIKIFEKIIQNTKSPATLARAYDNLGFAYFKSGDNRSLGYYKKGYELRNKENLKADLIVSNLHLSDYYKNSNPSLSTQYAKEAYNGATKIKRIDDRLEALERLTALSAGPELKNYSLQFYSLNDSIDRVRKANQYNFAQIKYDYKQTQEENLVRKTSEAQKVAQLAKAENRQLIMGILLLAGLGTLIFVVKHMREKNKREKQLESYKTETRLSKKIHDELANDVFHTMTFADMNDLSIKKNKDTLLDALDKIYNGSRNISRENSSIDTGKNYPNELKELIKGYKSEQINVMSNGIDNINWDEVEAGKKIVVYRVLHELLVNMKKHSKSTLVVARFQINGKKIQVDYSDNGIGIDKNKLSLKNGLRNMETRIESINGTYTFDSVPNKGFKVSFSFPK